MNRYKVIESLETRLFEVYSRQPLSGSERYSIISRPEEKNGRLSFGVVGSNGTETVLWAGEPLPTEPFLIMRGLPASNGSDFHYQAISVSDLEALTRQIQASSGIVP